MDTITYRRIKNSLPFNSIFSWNAGYLIGRLNKLHFYTHVDSPIRNLIMMIVSIKHLHTHFGFSRSSCWKHLTKTLNDPHNSSTLLHCLFYRHQSRSAMRVMGRLGKGPQLWYCRAYSNVVYKVLLLKLEPSGKITRSYSWGKLF